MATVFQEIPNNDFVQVASGACIFQVKSGTVLVYVGGSKPPLNEKACFEVKESFSYTGVNKVWLRGLDSYNAIVIDTDL